MTVSAFGGGIFIVKFLAPGSSDSQEEAYRLWVFVLLKRFLV
jgi:hypothetical protein